MDSAKIVFRKLRSIESKDIGPRAFPFLAHLPSSFKRIFFTIKMVHSKGDKWCITLFVCLAKFIHFQLTNVSFIFVCFEKPNISIMVTLVNLVKSLLLNLHVVMHWIRSSYIFSHIYIVRLVYPLFFNFIGSA